MSSTAWLRTIQGPVVQSTCGRSGSGLWLSRLLHASLQEVLVVVLPVHQILAPQMHHILQDDH